MILILKDRNTMLKRRISFEVRGLVVISESWPLVRDKRIEVSVYAEFVSWSDPH